MYETAMSRNAINQTVTMEVIRRIKNMSKDSSQLERNQVLNDTRYAQCWLSRDRD